MFDKSTIVASVFQLQNHAYQDHVILNNNSANVEAKTNVSKIIPINLFH